MKVRRLPKDLGPAPWNAILPPEQKRQAFEDRLACDWRIIGAGAWDWRLRDALPTATTNIVVVLKARGREETRRTQSRLLDQPAARSLRREQRRNLDRDRVKNRMNSAAIDFAVEAAAQDGLDEECDERSPMRS
ncbi:hypothetical protein [Mesorhizobium sp. L2C067A000]|uniref:hypothetical protein n=1 Tax=Mesorhizobium sp. L2C067A000 TaxID=1287106 RepID=UPI0003CFFAE2|nr:hypothetical protein [Mesorhizobium sp. L2C067A000]ESZ23108.1 hypothetical protein X733_33485 [Mesorhizobium sp. L2C067A000]